jgi:hypothetical protein
MHATSTRAVSSPVASQLDQSGRNRVSSRKRIATLQVPSAAKLNHQATMLPVSKKKKEIFSFAGKKESNSSLVQNN